MRGTIDDGTDRARSNDRRYTLFTDLARNSRECQVQIENGTASSNHSRVISNDFSARDDFLGLTARRASTRCVVTRLPAIREK